MAWKIIVAVLASYLIGSINPSYIFGRLKGIDIRRQGSGNAGASNATVILGKSIGIFSALFDIAKAFGVMLLFPLIFKDVPYLAECAGVAAIIGHIFPIFMKFKGGKGLACLGGLLLAIDPWLFLIMLSAEIVLLLLVNFICIVPITASILIPIAYGVLGADGLDWLRHAEGGWWGAAIISIASIVMLWRHRENVARIAKGKEMHFSYIWMSSEDRKKELIRIGKYDEQQELAEKLEIKI